MRHLKLTALFCGPSLLSGVLVALGAAALLAMANFSYLLRSGLIYDALFGNNSPLDLIQQSHNSASALNQTIFGNPTLNKILFLCFWVMIGLFVYITVIALGQTVSSTEQDIKSRHYIHANKALIARNLLLRMALRISGVLAAFIFGWVFFRFLIPFCIFSSRVGLSQLSSPAGWGYLLLGFTVLIVSLHGIVIIARLAAARPRIFGTSS